jgi:hypothetical protein
MNANQNLCGCGCGEPAGVYKSSGGYPPNRVIKGTPRKFIHGHHVRLKEYQQPARDFDTCYTVQPNGCHTWNFVNEGDDGYGTCTSNGKKVKAHRFAYERAHGPIPAGVHIDHLCHDPATCAGGKNCPHRACVNPEHLAIASHADNCRRGSNAKLDMEKAREIRARFAAGETGVILAAEFGVLPTNISHIVNGHTWTET